ncbi:cell wall metabolism sensor histidine kinase WalK [Nocardioides sp. L-11A]|uniref:sensor histidine kinase n=1 Tax=Nocardioides sp. L-11A TaxID=3043848 RepID=UPI00249C8D8D|nr:HAMP domain-containing sensor histidine kinase [Nocardioides sp. L-11A]
MTDLVPRSLTSRLVVTSVALVAVVSLLVGTVTTLGMRAWLTNRLDSDVASLTRGGPAGGPGGGLPNIFGADGTVRAFYADGVQQGSVLSFTGNGIQQRTLEPDVLALLADSGHDPTTVDLPGLGSYRVVRSRETRDGIAVVAGLPTQDVDEATSSLIQLEIVLALLGIVVAALAGTAVVRRQLRPLTEVAATAHAVAELPLDEGEIGVTERVPERLTDPRTEAGQVGLALNQLLAHVESSLSARHRSEQQVRQFVADASHELRTPLTTIAGYTELARRRGDTDTAAVALAKVEEEAGRMTALVEDLLLLARLDAGRPLATEPVDLTRLLLEAVDDARVVAPDHRWRIVLPDGGDPVETAGDEHRLHQVVTNLLANARTYTPAGTTVTVTVRADGFEVHDDGPGFPADLVDTAFERFTRGDSSRHRSDGGAGLGLALVQAIVSAHGGSVALRSTPGDTLVTVRL